MKDPLTEMRERKTQQFTTLTRRALEQLAPHFEMNQEGNMTLQATVLGFLFSLANNRFEEFIESLPRDNAPVVDLFTHPQGAIRTLVQATGNQSNSKHVNRQIVGIVANRLWQILNQRVQQPSNTLGREML